MQRKFDAPVRIGRLLKLAEFIETLPSKQFNFGHVWNEDACGSAGCAIGWAPHVFASVIRRPSLFAQTFWVGHDLMGSKRLLADYELAAQVLFNITEDEAHKLFTPGRLIERYSPGLKLQSNSPAKAVAANIRAFVKQVKDSGNDPRPLDFLQLEWV